MAMGPDGSGIALMLWHFFLGYLRWLLLVLMLNAGDNIFNDASSLGPATIFVWLEKHLRHCVRRAYSQAISTLVFSRAPSTWRFTKAHTVPYFAHEEGGYPKPIYGQASLSRNEQVGSKDIANNKRCEVAAPPSFSAKKGDLSGELRQTLRLKRHHERAAQKLKMACRGLRAIKRARLSSHPDILPARLYPRAERGQLRDYHHTQHQAAEALRKNLTPRALPESPALARPSIARRLALLSMACFILALVASVWCFISDNLSTTASCAAGVLAVLAAVCSARSPICAFDFPAAKLPDAIVLDHGLKTKIPDIVADREPLIVLAQHRIKKDRDEAMRELDSTSAPPATPPTAPKSQHVVGAGSSQDTEEANTAANTSPIDPSHNGKPRKKRIKTAERSEDADTIPTFALSTDLPQLDLDSLPITRDESTGLLNEFIESVRRYRILPKPLRHEYTPMSARAQHVLDLPVREGRQWELEEGSVELYDHLNEDLTQSRAWRLRATNKLHPGTDPVDLFTMQRLIRSYDACYECRGLGPAIREQCERSNGQAPCPYCKEHGKADECNAGRALYQKARGTNLITQDVCPESERDLVIKLGKLKCDVMNRAPNQFDTTTWGCVTYSHSLADNVRERAATLGEDRRKLAIVSLVEWKKHHKPSFDMSQLRAYKPASSKQPHTDGRWVSAWTELFLGKPTEIKQPPMGTDRAWSALTTIGIFVRSGKTLAGHHQASFVQPVHLQPGDVSEEALEQYAAQLDTYGIINRPDPALDEYQLRAYRALQQITLEMVGLAGSYAALTESRNDLKTEIALRRLAKTAIPGPYNNHKSFWLTPLKANRRTYVGPRMDTVRTTLRLSQEVLENLQYDEELRLRNATRTAQHTDVGSSAAQTKGKEPHFKNPNRQDNVRLELTLATKVQDHAALAFVAQQSVLAVKAGKDLLNCIFAAFLTAQLIENGVLARDQFLAQFCSCKPDEKSENSHPCMFCFRWFPCDMMADITIDDHRTIVCQACLKRETASGKDIVLPAPYGIGPVEHKIRDSVNHVHLWERRHGISEPFDKQTMITTLRDRHAVDLDSGEWHPGYYQNLATANVSTANYGQDQMSIYAHPEALSVEKPHSRWLDNTNGTYHWVLHHMQNVTLVPLCINLCKGNTPPAAVRLLKKALQLKNGVAALPVREDSKYPGMEGEWAKFERATNHLRLTQFLLSPWSSKARVNEPIEDQSSIARQFESNCQAEKSGHWNGFFRQGPFPQMCKNLFTSRGQQPQGWQHGSNHEWAMWSDHDWSNLLKRVEEIHQRFNKHGLQIPYVGYASDVPWIFRMDLCPTDVDKEFIFHEFAERLKTMRDKCDPNHLTQETPATLFLEAVVQWYERGGKCHFFGFQLTHAVNHFCSYSFGRGFVKLNKDGTETQLPILAGDHMKTGFQPSSDKVPTSMDQYDYSRRSIIMESWKANVLRYYYPPSIGGRPLFQVLEEIIFKLADKCAWYADFDELEYGELPLPKSYKDRSGFVEAMRRVTVTKASATQVVEGEAEEEDEEDAWYNARIEESRAMMENAEPLIDEEEVAALLQKLDRIEHSVKKNFSDKFVQVEPYLLGMHEAALAADEARMRKLYKELQAIVEGSESEEESGDEEGAAGEEEAQAGQTMTELVWQKPATRKAAATYPRDNGNPLFDTDTGTNSHVGRLSSYDLARECLRSVPHFASDENWEDMTTDQRNKDLRTCMKLFTVFRTLFERHPSQNLIDAADFLSHVVESRDVLPGSQDLWAFCAQQQRQRQSDQAEAGA